MDIVLGVVLMLMGAGSFAAVFIERIRPNWQGLRIKTSATSCLGFGLGFFVVGALTVDARFSDSRLPDWLGILVFPGVLLVLIGSFTDK